MNARARPVVYISYTWINVVDREGRPVRAPDPRARELADWLRANGIDVRLDTYFAENLHGFRQPERVKDDPREPWLVWLAQQIAEADAVLLFCTPEYWRTSLYSRLADKLDQAFFWSHWRDLGEGFRIEHQLEVPGVWWDWLAIERECTERPNKFIPVGIGPYDTDVIPDFVRGAHYLNISNDSDRAALLRRIRLVWRERVPRRGVFISYAHKNDTVWLDTLLRQMSWLQRDRGIEFWSDRDIEPGAKWHETIQTELDRAKVAVLLVSQDFLASPYIASNELPGMLEAAETEGMTIFWIPVRPSQYKHSPIAKFQAAYSPDKPLARLRGAERDQAFVDIGDKLAKVLGVVTSTHP